MILSKNHKILVFVVGLSLGLEWTSPNDPPMFFTMDKEWQSAIQESEIITFQGFDTSIQHEARLMLNTDHQPLLYFSDLETPVCADGECRVAEIKIYWNLLGNYVGYGLHNDAPLTKYDHDPFETVDYKKLHHLLLDNNSILRRKKMSDLVDKVPSEDAFKLTNTEVDAVTSATRKEIKEAVVPGGLYSCYTLWHLVHGEVKEKISSNLPAIYSDSINLYFLYSAYKDYQSYALKQLSEEDFSNHKQQILKIFEKAQPLLRTYLLKKIPDHVLANQNFSDQLYHTFSRIDVNSRTALIKKLGTADSSAAGILAHYLPDMTRNQLKTYLEFLNLHPGHYNKTIEAKLREASQSEELANAYLIKAFLENE